MFYCVSCGVSRLAGCFASTHYFQVLGFCVNFSVTGVTEVNLSGVTLMFFFHHLTFSFFYGWLSYGKLAFFSLFFFSLLKKKKKEEEKKKEKKKSPCT